MVSASRCRVRIADGEVLNVLFFSVLVDFEVVPRELGDEPALSVADGDADLNEVHARLEDWHLLVAFRRRRRRHGGHKGDKGHQAETDLRGSHRALPLCPL